MEKWSTKVFGKEFLTRFEFLLYKNPVYPELGFCFYSTGILNFTYPELSLCLLDMNSTYPELGLCLLDMNPTYPELGFCLLDMNSTCFELGLDSYYV